MYTPDIRIFGNMSELLDSGYILYVWLAATAVFSMILLQSTRSESIISLTVGYYLRWRYRITSEDGRTEIPTVPYCWPNGQGDTGKFLDGIENSERWAKQYGDVYRIWSGTSPEIVLTSPDHIRAVFKDSNTHSKAINNNSGYMMSQLLGRCLGLISGEEWRAVRSVTEVPFHHKAAAQYLPIIDKQTSQYFKELERNGHLNQGLIDPAEDLKMLPFWIVAEILYGELSADMKVQLRELAPVREAVFRHIVRGGLPRFSWSKYLPTKSNWLLRDYKRRWTIFNEMAYARAKVTAAAGNANGASEPASIVRMYRAMEQGQFSREELLQTLDEMLYANLDVTIGGISWNLVFLAAHIDAQDRLRREVRENTSESRKRNSYLQSTKTFLAACISESSRLRPLAAFSVPQSAPTERLVSGYIIPTGVNYIVDAYALNIRSEYWGSDRATYRPQRFLDRCTSEMRYNFWRFGFGPRQCLGKYVADLIIRSILVQLISNYYLELIDSNQEWLRNGEVWITHPKILLKCSIFEEEE
ncbi:cytochrome P450 [Phaeosphaeriaceae sp. PMI808]|nr:cytochrome P450 [Phaeosphaeriaceae sp. PMI808]